MTERTAKPSLNYKTAGVDIDAGAALVERIKPIAQRTKRPEVMAGLGGFGALCQLPSGYKEPVLVSGADGVGTKLRLAIELGMHETIGIDLVAMCANDIVVTGAEPLFFLDYYATGRLDVNTAASVVEGIARGCEMAGCALVGGETAEMPGMYANDDYDLAGFCVGVVEKSAIIDGRAVRAGDRLIALASSGAHANGYSLIRHIIDQQSVALNTPLGTTTLAQALMAPTRIYVRALHALMAQCSIHAMCHVTGGGLLDNLPRVLPQSMQAVVDRNSWQWPAVFAWLARCGRIETHEMYRTFNCGVGMVIVIDPSDTEAALAHLAKVGEKAWVLGHVESSDRGEPKVVLR